MVWWSVWCVECWMLILDIWLQCRTPQMTWYSSGIPQRVSRWWWSHCSCPSWSWSTTPQRTAPPPTPQVRGGGGTSTVVWPLMSAGNFTCLMVVFKFRRRLGYFMFHTYIPTCLIVMMSWISFWIKPEAVPARVTLGVTSLLTLSTQHANSQKSLPPVSYIKVWNIFSISRYEIFSLYQGMEYVLW